MGFAQLGLDQQTLINCSLFNFSYGLDRSVGLWKFLCLQKLKLQWYEYILPVYHWLPGWAILTKKVLWQVLELTRI